jgi:hypothetical protein
MLTVRGMVASNEPAAPNKMAIARDAAGREVITVSSAQVFSWKLAVPAAAMIAIHACLYAASVSDPRFLVFAYALPVAWVGTAGWIAGRVLRELRGWDRMTFGADALALEQRGAWWTRATTIRYADIVDLQVELQPRWLPERQPVVLRLEPLGYRIVLFRRAGRPVHVAHRFGHPLDAATWLVEQIRRGAGLARRRD